MVQEVEERKLWLMHLLRRRPKTVLYIASVNSFKSASMIFKHLVLMRDYVQIVYLIFKYLVLALFFLPFCQFCVL